MEHQEIREVLEKVAKVKETCSFPEVIEVMMEFAADDPDSFMRFLLFNFSITYAVNSSLKSSSPVEDSDVPEC